MESVSKAPPTSSPLRLTNIPTCFSRHGQNASRDVAPYSLLRHRMCSCPWEVDTDCHHHAVRDLDCAMVAEYKRAERARTNLRLVYHRWDHIFEGYSDRLVQLTLDSPSGCWPPVKHWDHVVRSQGPHSIFATLKTLVGRFWIRRETLVSDRFFSPLSANLQMGI